MDTLINTFQQEPTLSNTRESEIPARAMAYFRARLSNKIHSLVLTEFSKQESMGVISKASLARRIGKKPEQITRWLGSSGNWTVETLSDLLLGMELEPSISLKKISDAYSSSSASKSNEKIVFNISDDDVADKQLVISLEIDKYYSKITKHFSTSSINQECEFNPHIRDNESSFVVSENKYNSIGDSSYRILEIAK